MVGVLSFEGSIKQWLGISVIAYLYYVILCRLVLQDLSKWFDSCLAVLVHKVWLIDLNLFPVQE